MTVARDPVMLAARQLLAVLRTPAGADAFALADWDGIVRVARQSRLLGVLDVRLAAHPAVWAAVPAAVRGHLLAARALADHRRQMVALELQAAAAALPAGSTVLLLKGAAYIAQGLMLAQGRLPNDVDLMVPRAELDAAEAALTAAGWQSEVSSAYDQRYYRAWSHELPPMRRRHSPIELDLHHAVTPVTGRLRPDMARMFAEARPLAGSPYRVLHPLDQILHAAVHLMQDSELDSQLRDLVDIDGLVRAHLQAPADWQALWARAQLHGLERPLWYALRYGRRFLHTPVPAGSAPGSPPAAVLRTMDWIVSRTLLPRVPDAGLPADTRCALLLGRIRYHWLRMPPRLLLPHLVRKGWLRWRPRPV